MERQRALFIFIAAGIAASLLTWFLYATTKAPHVEKTVAIQAAARDMPTGTLLKKGDLKTVHVQERDLPKSALVDAGMVIDHPLLFPVTANEPITATKIASSKGIEGLPASIEIGKRAISVPITDSSGVSGLIQPRAHVDVLFTKPGSAREAVTTTILEDVIVLAMGRTTEGTSSSTTANAVAAAAARPSAQSATLLVTPEQSQRLELAKNQGKISLALRNPLDHTQAADLTETTSQDLYSVQEPAHSTPAPPQKPTVIVQKIEPPKPKNVIEVFRGDKHVQEVFK
jgi:pilus assembly protein CpaB